MVGDDNDNDVDDAFSISAGLTTSDVALGGSSGLQTHH